MKTIAALLGAAALFGGVQSYHEQDGDGPALAAQEQLSGRFRLTANGGEAECTVRRGAELSGGLSLLAVSADCRAVLPGIERARYWRERKDGTVGFSENGADPIVSFAAGDGIAYESYAPALPLLSLAAVR